jgi:hypothetical protein
MWVASLWTGEMTSSRCAIDDLTLCMGSNLRHESPGAHTIGSAEGDLVAVADL